MRNSSSVSQISYSYRNQDNSKITTCQIVRRAKEAKRGKYSRDVSAQRLRIYSVNLWHVTVRYRALCGTPQALASAVGYNRDASLPHNGEKYHECPLFLLPPHIQPIEGLHGPSRGRSHRKGPEVPLFGVHQLPQADQSACVSNEALCARASRGRTGIVALHTDGGLLSNYSLHSNTSSPIKTISPSLMPASNNALLMPVVSSIC